MEDPEFSVLTRVRDWLDTGHRVWLVSVIETWGSSPRPPGALLAVRDDGAVAGSVSGGCIEDDLIRRIRAGEWPERPETVRYGVSSEQAFRFRLPCGGTLRVLIEPLHEASWLTPLLTRISQRQLVTRTVELASGRVTLSPGRRGERPVYDGERLHCPFGPHWRLLLIGAGQLSQLLAQMAQPVGFEVLVCDPRPGYRVDWPTGLGRWIDGMPDDAVSAISPDPRTAIVALSHDPKLDDMALLEALKSPAFYVGALGSRRHSALRRERLALFDLAPQEIDRLHGPVGLYLGSRSPAEIAVAVLAEMVAVKNGVEVRQLPPPLPADSPPEPVACGMGPACAA
ncbi:XdhC family protein [Chitinimonas lacunae]|uniref:XdhC family protein n=1 Tax=Chitinimonas lacunae TaxID=1963018 RepID=A0ABV8MPS5_9NEIS